VSARVGLADAGQYTDAETGFQYLRARYYDPATGQFLTRDPIEAVTREANGYVGGNPLNVTDRSGLSQYGSANCKSGQIDTSRWTDEQEALLMSTADCEPTGGGGQWAGGPSQDWSVNQGSGPTASCDLSAAGEVTSPPSQRRPLFSPGQRRTIQGAAGILSAISTVSSVACLTGVLCVLSGVTGATAALLYASSHDSYAGVCEGVATAIGVKAGPTSRSGFRSK
jgi:RHS repeat-associated protein